MKLNLKKIIIMTCVGLLSTIICASDERKEDLCFASSSSSSSSSWSTPAIQAPTHPLAKIFPLSLTPIQSLPGKYAAIDQEIQYVALKSSNGSHLYDVGTGQKIITNLPINIIYSSNFSTMVSSDVIPNQPTESLFNFYDFQTKRQNPMAQPFFSSEGQKVFLSPDGNYAAILKEAENQNLYYIYDIHSHDSHRNSALLFALHGGDNISFSSNSKKIKIERAKEVEIVDIALAINADQQIFSSILLEKSLIVLPLLSPDLRYVIYRRRSITNPTYNLELFSTDSLISNIDSETIFSNKLHHTAASFSSDSKMITLSKNDKTEVYSIDSLEKDPDASPVYTVSGINSIFSPHNNFIISSGHSPGIFNIFNIAIQKESLHVRLFNHSLIFSSNGTLILPAIQIPTMAYDLETNIMLIKAPGNAIALNNQSGRLLTKFLDKVLIFDVLFLNDPAFKKIIQGKLSLAQLALVSMLNQYYGAPIKLATIALDKNMGEAGLYVLRNTLSTFPEIIKQGIIKTYNIADVLTNKEKRQLQAQENQEPQDE